MSHSMTLAAPVCVFGWGTTAAHAGSQNVPPSVRGFNQSDVLSVDRGGLGFGVDKVLAASHSAGGRVLVRDMRLDLEESGRRTTSVGGFYPYCFRGNFVRGAFVGGDLRLGAIELDGQIGTLGGVGVHVGMKRVWVSGLTVEETLGGGAARTNVPGFESVSLGMSHMALGWSGRPRVRVLGPS